MRRVPLTVLVCLTIACARGAPAGEVTTYDRPVAAHVGTDGKVAHPAPTRADRAVSAGAPAPGTTAATAREVAASAGHLAALDSSSARPIHADSGGRHARSTGRGHGEVTTLGVGSIGTRGRGGSSSAGRAMGSRSAGLASGIGSSGGDARGDSSVIVSRLVPGDLAGSAVGEASGFGGLGLRGGGGKLSARATSVPANLSPLRAGATDDNADLDAFLHYLGTWNALSRAVSAHCRLDVQGPRRIVVRDLDEQPVPGARVEVRDPGSGDLLFAGTTFGDGSQVFYPQVFARRAARDRALVVRVEALGRAAEVALPTSDDGPVYAYLDRPRAPVQPVPLDVAFLLDTTGSMQDEIDRIKQTLRQVTAELRGSAQGVDLRYGAVLYRDLGDDYVTRVHPLTADLDAFDSVLRAIRAGGGGDTPESLNQALDETVHRLAWRPGAARVVFLIADAPPHLDYQDDTPYGDSLKDALARGIRIHSVAASGLDDVGSLVFRQIAQFTRGQFIFIEYGGNVTRSAAAHGVGGQVQSNNLDAIILGRLRWEIDRFGREAAASPR